MLFSTGTFICRVRQWLWSVWSDLSTRNVSISYTSFDELCSKFLSLVPHRCWNSGYMLEHLFSNSSQSKAHHQKDDAFFTGTFNLPWSPNCYGLYEQIYQHWEDLTACSKRWQIALLLRAAGTRAWSVGILAWPTANFFENLLEKTLFKEGVAFPYSKPNQLRTIPRVVSRSPSSRGWSSKLTMKSELVANRLAMGIFYWFYKWKIESIYQFI